MKPSFAALLFPVLALSAYGAKIEYEAPNGIPPVESPVRRLDWNLNRAYSEKSGERLRISLNTYWNFLPCDSADRTIPPDNAAWGYFIVPGYWRSSGLGEAMRSADGRAVRKFNGRLVTDYPAAWYRRTFNPPASMKGKKVQLYFELFYSNPEVYINGRKVPVPSSFTPRYQVPVDSFLKYINFCIVYTILFIKSMPYNRNVRLWGKCRFPQNTKPPFPYRIFKKNLFLAGFSSDFIFTCAA